MESANESQKWKRNASAIPFADDESNSILLRPPQRSLSMSPNGALPVILPPDTIRYPKVALPVNQHHYYSPTKRLDKKVSFCNQPSVKETKPDMRHDDDEFAFVAHLLLNYLRWNDDSSSTMDQGCQHSTFQDAIDTIYYAATGEKFYKPEERPRPPPLTDHVLLDFHAALKYRLKYLSVRPSSKEDEVTALTRELSRVLSIHRMPFIQETLSQSNKKREKHSKEEEEEREGLDQEYTRNPKPARQHFFPDHGITLREDYTKAVQDQPTSQPQPQPQQQPVLDDKHTTQNENRLPESLFVDHPPIERHVDEQTFDSVYYTTHEHMRRGYHQHTKMCPQTITNHDVYDHDEETQPMAGTCAPLESDVFEVVGDVEPPLRYDEILVAESVEYDGDPDADIFEIRESADEEFLPTTMIPDRSFEAETVVFSEFYDSSQYQMPDQSFENDTVVMRECQNQRQNITPEIKCANYSTTEAVIAQQNIQQEIQRVSCMMHSTSNETVKTACQERMYKLQFSLNQLLELKIMNRVSTDEVPPPKGKSELDMCSYNDGATEFNGETYRAGESETTLKHTTSYQKVNIISPLDLPSDFQFQAHIGDQSFIATVPQGGVKKGEEFQNALVVNDEIAKITTNTIHRIGRWNDGMFACFTFGPLHASVLNSFFCPMISLAQVMTRLKVGWLGLPGRQHRFNDTFRISLLLSMFVVIINCLLYYLPHSKFVFGGFSLLQVVLFGVFNTFVSIYFIVNTVITRRRLRERYMIPTEHSCGRFEDALFTFPCSFLVLMQMHRHTADYDTYSAQCCSSNGLPTHVVVKLPSTITANSFNVLNSDLTEPLRINHMAEPLFK